MNFILTLSASRKPLAAEHVAAVANYADANGLGIAGVPDWLAPGRAVDIPVARRPARANVEALWRILEEDRIDLFIMPAAGRRKKLLLADMDATIVTGETLDDMAARAGMGAEIAAITARAMRGELDFRAALAERVMMLRGQDERLLHDTLAHIELSDGAAELVRGMKDQGATCVLVSGGFTFFTARIAARAGFDYHHGNVLGIENGTLSGAVEEPVLDKNAKLKFLQQYAQQLTLDPAETMAVGDGANDLPMLEAAGLGIGFRPKPLLQQSLDNCIFYGGLDAALYAQGFRNMTGTAPA